MIRIPENDKDPGECARIRIPENAPGFRYRKMRQDKDTGECARTRIPDNDEDTGE